MLIKILQACGGATSPGGDGKGLSYRKATIDNQELNGDSGWGQR